MNDFFIVLLLVSFLGLIVGLIKPSWIKMPSRKRVGMIFGGAIVVFFVLVGITSPTAPAGTPVASNPAQTTNATNSGPKLSDADYINSVQTNVIPAIQKAQKDMRDPTLAIYGGQYLEDLVTASETEAQADFSQAQKNIQSLNGQAPSDLSQADSLLNQAVSSQISGINALVAAINVAVPKGGFSFLDPDAANAAFTSIEQGNSDESQALDLIKASPAITTSQAAAIKQEQQTLADQTFQGAQQVLQTQQALKHNVQGNISKLGGGIQADYGDLRINAADPDRPAGTTGITVFVNVGNFLDKSALLDVTNKLSAQLFQTVYSSGNNAYDVLVEYDGQTTDAYGNQHNNTPVLIYGMDKDTYQKINWSGFDQSTLCDFLKQQGIIEGGTGNDACNTLVNIQ